jgi:hypothetical protein
VGLIAGFSVAQFAASLYVIHWALKTLEIPVAVLVRRVMMPILVGLFSGGLVLVIKPYLLPDVAAWQRLLATGTLFTLVFLALAWLLDRETVTELRKLIRRKQKANPPTEAT